MFSLLTPLSDNYSYFADKDFVLIYSNRLTCPRVDYMKVVQICSTLITTTKFSKIKYHVCSKSSLPFPDYKVSLNQSDRSQSSCVGRRERCVWQCTPADRQNKMTF